MDDEKLEVGEKLLDTLHDWADPEIAFAFLARALGIFDPRIPEHRHFRIMGVNNDEVTGFLSDTLGRLVELGFLEHRSDPDVGYRAAGKRYSGGFDPVRGGFVSREWIPNED